MSSEEVKIATGRNRKKDEERSDQEQDKADDRDKNEPDERHLRTSLRQMSQLTGISKVVLWIGKGMNLHYGDEPQFDVLGKVLSWREQPKLVGFRCLERRSIHVGDCRRTRKPKSKVKFDTKLEETVAEAIRKIWHSYRIERVGHKCGHQCLLSVSRCTSLIVSMHLLTLTIGPQEPKTSRMASCTNSSNWSIGKERLSDNSLQRYVHKANKRINSHSDSQTGEITTHLVSSFVLAHKIGIWYRIWKNGWKQLR